MKLHSCEILVWEFWTKLVSDLSDKPNNKELVWELRILDLLKFEILLIEFSFKLKIKLESSNIISLEFIFGIDKLNINLL